MSNDNLPTREFLDLKFENLGDALMRVELLVERQNTKIDEEIDLLKKRVEALETGQSRILAIGGTIWAGLTLVAGYILQRLF